MFNYSSVEPEELSFIEGDVLFIIDKSSDPEWWKVHIGINFYVTFLQAAESTYPRVNKLALPLTFVREKLLIMVV